MSAPRVWLVTGSSSGFGLELCKLIASKGDRVIAGSRSPERLSGLGLAGLIPAHLDPNEPLPKIQEAMTALVATHGHIDIVVNNAAYAQTGIIEEITPEDTFKQFQANTFGPVNVYRAILPHMRDKRSGILVTVGSVKAHLWTAGCSMYDASKAALRTLTLSLADEVEPFGIKHCLIEPGSFRTDLVKPGANMKQTDASTRSSAYSETNKRLDGIFDHLHGNQVGDPEKGVALIYDIATCTGVAEGRELPTFVPLGSDAVVDITRAAQRVIDGTNAWADIARRSDV